LEVTYHITVDRRINEKRTAPHLRELCYDVDNGKIVCDGKKVTITSNDETHLEKLKVAFQLACRYTDRWAHHFRLSTDEDLLKETEVNLLDIINDRKLEEWCRKLAGLDYTVLLYIHRASDFINLYAEVAVITALFGLELQVNKVYDHLEECGLICSKRESKCVEGLYDKICNLKLNDFIKDEERLKILLALTGLRNKLAHVKLNKLKTAEVCGCDNKKIDKLQNILGLKDDDFIDYRGESRLKHLPSERLIDAIIDSITFLRSICS
jgi:hypothetical protein